MDHSRAKLLAESWSTHAILGNQKSSGNGGNGGAIVCAGAPINAYSIEPFPDLMLLSARGRRTRIVSENFTGKYIANGPYIGRGPFDLVSHKPV